MKTLREIRIDRTKTLAEDPGTGHNRWHPDIPPVIRCDLGDEVILDTQQAYAICSVAVDLKISQLVDVPNMLVSAFLPEDIFTR